MHKKYFSFFGLAWNPNEVKARIFSMIVYIIFLFNANYLALDHIELLNILLLNRIIV